MTDNTKSIPAEASAKLHFLQTDAEPRRVLGHARSLNSFASKLGISRETLRDQVGREQLSEAIQHLLAEKLRFDVSWPEWVSGTATEFKSRYIREAAQIRARNRRTNIRLERGARREPIACSVNGLAATELDGSQFGVGSVSIEVTVSCAQPPILGTPKSVRFGRIELKCGQAVITRETLEKWIASARKIVGTKGAVQVAFAAGTRSAPAWNVSADGPSIGTVFIDPSFASLEELAPGDEIELQFGTWLGDISDEADTNDDVSGISLVDPDGGAVRVPAKDVSTKKRRIIAALRKRLLPSDDSGYVVLAKHSLQVVERQA